MNGTRDLLNDVYAVKVWPSILFLSVVMVTGSLGNLLVCVVYRFDLSKVNNRFILALTGIDLINCLAAMPGEIANLRFKYSFGDSSYCPAMRFFQSFSCLGSAGILVAISVDRFQKVCKPFGKQTTHRKSTAAIFVSIILSLFFASPAAVINGRRTGFVNGVSTAECSIADLFLETSFSAIYLGFFCLLFTGSCLNLVVMYSLIWKRLRKQKTFRTKVSQRPKGTTQLSQFRKTSNSVLDVTRDQDENSKAPISQNGDSNQRQDNALTSQNEDISGRIQDKTKIGQTVDSGDVEVLPPNGPLGVGQLTTHISVLMDSNDVKSTPNHRPSSMGKTTIMMLLVTVAFILSFLPPLCLTTAEVLDRKSFQNLTNVQLASSDLFRRVHFLNSAINPFIYSFFSLQFRVQLMNLRRAVLSKLGSE